MTDDEHTGTLRRILISLDASEESQAALEATARLAASLRAELVGLFVEDVELLEAAALPVTHLIPRQARARVALDAELMRRALRVGSARAHESLADVAARWRVKWSFQVARGVVSELVLAEARGGDVLVLGASGGMQKHVRAGAGLRRMTAEAPCSILHLKGRELAARPVVVLYEGAERVLAVGLELARGQGRDLRVLAVGADRKTVAVLKRRASAWLAERNDTGEVAGLVGGLASEDTLDIRQALRGGAPGVVVLDRRSALAPRLDAQGISDELDCSVFALMC